MNQVEKDQKVLLVSDALRAEKWTIDHKGRFINPAKTVRIQFNEYTLSLSVKDDKGFFRKARRSAWFHVTIENGVGEEGQLLSHQWKNVVRAETQAE